ncbi:hypothetical protein ciss_03290 [Carboxydothermus islandicus]|uniref:4Fe-4S Mo/W bis-MGD-type domain-containing protein n=1 Tax=Carboxydothermus islandicus TaxID=661089 RepID=A0A1L8CZM5_9THEO|nr:molybdopterin oxidoreductase family protein [Carboxydothermus islandicus]GAV24396.1 hypothetical protein ciss_03290 [Carboxydothermus islandicus]
MAQKFTRRKFLKGAGAGAALMGLKAVEKSRWIENFSRDIAEAANLPAEKWVNSVCPYCACGCSILYGVRQGKVVSVRGNPEAWNRGGVCIKGATLADLYLFNSPGVKDRLKKPLLRDPEKRGSLDNFREVSWDEALDYMVKKVKEYTKTKFGDKHPFAMYGSGQASLEFNYLAAKFNVIGMNIHNDNNGRLCQATQANAMVISFGIDGPPMSFDDVFEADNLFLFGFSIADTLPGWFGKLVEAKVQKGDNLKIAVIDPVKISATQILNYKAGDLYLPIIPTTDVAFINSMAHVIIYELEGVNRDYAGDASRWADDVISGKVKPKHIDTEFIAKYVNFYRGDYQVLARLGKEGPKIFDEIKLPSGLEGFKEYAKFLAAYKPENVAQTTGLTPADIRKAAQMFVRNKNTMSMYLQGFGQQSNGVSKHLALVTLHAVTGRLGRAGAGVMPSVGQPNGLGQRVGGAVVGRLPGNRNHALAAHRASLAKALARGNQEMEAKILERLEDPVTKNSRLSLTSVDIFKNLKNGNIKGVWTVCNNPMVAFPNLNMVHEALRKADLVVVQDIYPTETMAFADVVLPAAALSGEACGTYLNSERRVQMLEKAVEPPGDALPDGIILLAFVYKYQKALAAEGRQEEADFLKFLLEPIIQGYEPLFENVQANIRELREANQEIQKRLFSELAYVSKGIPGNDFSGLSYERLRTEKDAKGYVGFKLPVLDSSHKGLERLYDENYEAVYQKRFATPDGKLRCFLFEQVHPAEEWIDAEYPFMLTLPRIYEHWHTRTRTGRCAMPHRLRPEAWLSINPNDAKKLGIKDGDWVEVESRRGKVTVKAKIDTVKTPREGVVWMPWAYGFLGNLFTGQKEAPPGKSAGNVLSTDAYDPVSKHPELKFTAVKIRKV